MCGIAGICNFSSGSNDSAKIRQMTSAMVHRGPDSDGIYEDDLISLGHRRLSVIDLSAKSNQPFTDASGRYVIVFNGELYNYPDVRNELIDYPFQSSGDTEVLVAAFAKWGPACISRFKGMFAFAIWDKIDEILYVFRDRMGVKPLYFFHDQHTFIFASEIRSILASGSVPGKLNKSALPDYFSFQSFGYPSSPICGIEQLEAGTYLKISKGRIEKTIYWRLGDKKPDADFNDLEGTRQQIQVLFRNAVSRRLVSDVPVGAFLSGGIDSSMVVAMMAEVSADRPSTFNISFSDKDFDESVFAEKVAKEFNTRHTNIELQPESFLLELENALDAMDSPSGDGINAFVVSKAVHNTGIKVALSGVGGDELFARYPFFKTYLQLQKTKPLFDHSAWIRKKIASLFFESRSGKNHRIGALLAAKSLSICQYVSGIPQNSFSFIGQSIDGPSLER